jgi:hypothetical protein
LRPEDFRTAWPNQLKVLVQMINTLLNTVNDTKKATNIETMHRSNEFRDTKNELSKQVGELSDLLSNTITKSSDQLFSQMDQRLKILIDATIALQSNIIRLSELESQLNLEKDSIRSLSLWGRLRLIIFGNVP